MPRWETRELTPTTWDDFEAFFGRYDGVQAGCWCMFYHREGPNGPLESRARQDQNRIDHKALVWKGRARGILVYADGQAVGWCQFGQRMELPRIERGRKYRSLAEALGRPTTWRITCFFVDRPFRRAGVARRALHGALQAIAAAGGGIVEAYPVSRPGAVALWFGTRSMFEREGFRVVEPFGRSHVLVRRRVPARTKSLSEYLTP
jgi:GNAT superfamily N-acetyltransferase